MAMLAEIRSRFPPDLKRSAAVVAYNEAILNAVIANKEEEAVELLHQLISTMPSYFPSRR